MSFSISAPKTRTSLGCRASGWRASIPCHHRKNWPVRLFSLEPVRDFLAALFGVVHRDLRGLLGPLGDVLTGFLGTMFGYLEYLLRAVGDFHRHGLGAVIHLGNRAFSGVEAVLADLVHFHGGFLGAFDRIMG